MLLKLIISWYKKYTGINRNIQSIEEASKRRRIYKKIPKKNK